jgi:transposase
MSILFGLDVHSKETFFFVQDGQGNRIGEGAIETTVEGLNGMLEKFDTPEGTRVALESGAQSHWVASVLSAAGMVPVVVDAREVRAKARRLGQKSDRRDAWEICDGLRRDIYTAIVWVPPAPVQRLRDVLSRRRHFVRLKTAEVNAAKYLLRSRGLAQGKRFALPSPTSWARLMADPVVAPVHSHLEMHARTWLLAYETVKALEEELAQALTPFRETLELLMTAPGVGPITAATYIAVIGTPERFPSSDQVVSYIGLAPSTWDSGDRERHGRITKRGSADLRTALVEAAHQASKSWHPLNPYFARVMVRSGYKRAVVAVAHRLARILYQIWRKKERFSAEHLNVEHGPHTISKMVQYRIKQKRTAA